MPVRYADAPPKDKALRRTNRASILQHTSTAVPMVLQRTITAVPLVLLNGVAFSGQLAFLNTHLTWVSPAKVMFAIALESVAVFLAYHAHLAMIAGDSSFRLRFASYIAGLIVGAANYSHYAPQWNHPNFTAVATGMASVASPWLWPIYTRHLRRTALREAGHVEAPSLRLGTARWLWHPIRSVKVQREASWTGERDITKAIAPNVKAPIVTPAPSMNGKDKAHA